MNIEGVLNAYDNLKETLKEGAAVVISTELNIRDIDQEIDALQLVKEQTNDRNKVLIIEEQIAGLLDKKNKQEIRALEARIRVQKELKTTSTNAEEARQRELENLENQLEVAKKNLVAEIHIMLKGMK